MAGVERFELSDAGIKTQCLNHLATPLKMVLALRIELRTDAYKSTIIPFNYTSINYFSLSLTFPKYLLTVLSDFVLIGVVSNTTTTHYAL